MTTSADFSREEWDQLRMLPAYVSEAIISSELHVGDVFAEGDAMFEAIDVQPVPDAAKELVEALKQDVKGEPYQGEPSPSGGLYVEPEFRKAMMLKRILDAADLLDAKASPEEALGFKQWLMSIAEAVAGSTAEGGLFGHGDEPVSDREKTALDEISEALGL